MSDVIYLDGRTYKNSEWKIVIRHFINDGYEDQYPVVEDGIKWETERIGSPGKLTFKLYKDNNGNLNFQEGDQVLFYQIDRFDEYLGSTVEIFSGVIFSKKRKKDKWIEVTAYDMLRYFKNKHTYKYEKKKASEVLKQICDDYHFPIGHIDDTKYVISERLEDNQSLFDIVQNALDITGAATGDKYALYCYQNKIYLENVENMKKSLVVNESSAEDFEYTSSIDKDTYNDVELFYDDDKSNKRNWYHALDETTIQKWGRLRYSESINSPNNAREKTINLLRYYNRKSRELKISKAFGNYNCIAGVSVIVDIDIGDITTNNHMLIEKATHTFKKDEYRMDLTVVGFRNDVINHNEKYSEYVPDVPTVPQQKYVEATVEAKDSTTKATSKTSTTTTTTSKTKTSTAKDKLPENVDTTVTKTTNVIKDTLGKVTTANKSYKVTVSISGKGSFTSQTYYYKGANATEQSTTYNGSKTSMTFEAKAGKKFKFEIVGPKSLGFNNTKTTGSWKKSGTNGKYTFEITVGQNVNLALHTGQF